MIYPVVPSRPGGSVTVPDVQGLVFQSALQWSAPTAATCVAIGLLYLLQGFRFARVLVALACGGAAYLAGRLAANHMDDPGPLSGLLLGLLATSLALARLRVGVIVCSMLVFGLHGYYFANLLGFSREVVPAAGLVFAGLGGFMFLVCVRALPIVLTSLVGSALLMVGFVGLAATFFPSLASTFVNWATTWVAVVPVFLLLFNVTGISVQSNAQQGDVRTGAASSFNSVEAT